MKIIASMQNIIRVIILNFNILLYERLEYMFVL